MRTLCAHLKPPIYKPTVNEAAARAEAFCLYAVLRACDDDGYTQLVCVWHFKKDTADVSALPTIALQTHKIS